MATSSAFEFEICSDGQEEVFSEIPRNRRSVVGRYAAIFQHNLLENYVLACYFISTPGSPLILWQPTKLGHDTVTS